MESNARPASSTPARRSTCQSYLTLWPAFGTAGSWSSATRGARAKSAIGGQIPDRRRGRELAGGAAGGRTAGTTPRSGSRRAKGRRARRREARATSVSASRPTSGARAQPRHERRKVLRVVQHHDLERGLARRARASRRRWRGGSAVGRGLPPPRPPAVREPRRGRTPRSARLAAAAPGGGGAPAPRRSGVRRGGRAAQPLRASEKNSSSVRIRISASRSGSRSTRSATSSSTGTSRWMVTSSFDSRAASACAEQRLAGTLGRDLGGAGKNGLEVAVLGEQLLGTLLADPLHAGDVVGGVADQGQEVHHLVRRHAQPLGGVGLVHPDLVHRRRAAAPGIEQGDAGPDELIEVLVARDDDRAEPARRPRPGQGADDVIGLVAARWPRAESGRPRAARRSARRRGRSRPGASRPASRGWTCTRGSAPRGTRCRHR